MSWTTSPNANRFEDHEQCKLCSTNFTILLILLLIYKYNLKSSIVLTTTNSIAKDNGTFATAIGDARVELQPLVKSQ